MTCAICSTPLDAATVVNTVARGGYPQTSVACPTCALVQVRPLPTDAELAAYYAEEYRRDFHDLPLGDLVPWSPPWIAASREAAAVYLRDTVFGNLGPQAKPLTALEVGAGHGFVAEALAAMGLRVDVVEPGEQCRERLRGLTGVTLLDAERVEDVAGRYDLVIALHVVEHMRDPVGFLAALHERASDGGNVWVEVPDVMRPYGPLSHFFQRPHLYNFSVHTLALAMIRAGFTDGCHVGPSTQAKVLCAWGLRAATVAPCSYEDAVQRLGRVLQGGRAEEVAQHLVEYEWRRTNSHGAMLSRWLSGESAESLGGERFETFLRHQFQEIDASGSTMRSNLHAWTQQVQGWAINRSTAWADTEWSQGYIAGATQMAQACQVRIVHLLNQDMLRGIGRDS